MKNDIVVDQFHRLVETLRILRSPDGCEWDRSQTAESLVPYLLEETYELIEAIELDDISLLKEELGDLLLHILFQSELAFEQDKFSINDVIKNITEKLVKRHPNVFAKNDKEFQEKTWEQLKQKEKKRNRYLDGVPKTLPALNRARRIQEKASAVGFDWEDVNPVWGKIYEELDELKEACKNNNQNSIKEELGDLIFSLVNLGRFLDVCSEQALKSTITKFENRFSKIELMLKARGVSLEDATLEEMDELWEDVKNNNE